jgi:hypothetical protein
MGVKIPLPVIAARKQENFCFHPYSRIQRKTRT